MATASSMLQRRLGLFQSTVINMIDMVGIGPFITLPIVMGLIGGMYLYAWIAGAILSLVDAMIWSELGAAYPLAGGSYNFLKEAYGKNGAGKMMSFLYVWQTVIQAPLVAASAAIGFSAYFVYLVPLEPWQQKAISGTVILFISFLLYRKIDSIGRIGILLWAGVIATLGWIIYGGLSHGNILQPLRDFPSSFSWEVLGSFAFGQACVKTIYSYLGYYNVCHLGGEIKDPGRNIPKSMFISVIGIAFLYLAMNLSVGSVISWQEIKGWQDSGQNNFVVSVFIERLYGNTAGIVATIMILWVALASLFAVMLGYSRVPYAAAVDGAFFSVFAKLHPTKNFPYVSLLLLTALAFIFSLLFRMGDIISGILAMRIMVQFVGQAAGIVLLRKRNGSRHLPYKMPAYPIPVILVIAMWLFIFYATGLTIISSFLAVFGSGLLVYMLMAKFKKEWPFHDKSSGA
ncbi:MAG TPA: APC family permease [Ferruginibacter sp.]|nr:APC family permease [Ferruginibacter sp.]